MAKKKNPGLYKRNGIWHIRKTIYGGTIQESTGTGDLTKAEEHLIYRIEQIRQQVCFGARKPCTFREAVVRYLEDKAREGKATIKVDKSRFRGMDKFVSHLHLDEIHMGTLEPLISDMKKRGVKNQTLNHTLKLIRQVLRLASAEWIDENGNTWLHAAPPIKLFDLRDARKPYPLGWEEEERLLAVMPEHIRRMAQFAINTGCREAEIVNLRWEWEYEVAELSTTVFIIPAWVQGKDGRLKGMVKNRTDRLVVLNETAKKVIEMCRGQHLTHVFSYRGKSITKIYNSAWKNNRSRAGLDQVRVHDLKHTFGFRLRSAGVSFEDRQDLLGHRSNRITTHYSSAELSDLIEAANKVCSNKTGKPKLTFRPMMKKEPLLGFTNSSQGV
jgi:integrase